MGSQGRLSEDGRIRDGEADAPELASSPSRAVQEDHPLHRSTVSFHEDLAEQPEMSSRKRSSKRQNGDGERDHEHSHSSADESAPIIRHQQGGPKDYQSISPRISARTSGVEGAGTRVQDGGADRIREGQRQEGIGGQDAARAAADTERREGSRWRKALEKYGSVELENKGSVARDHLALERTFLAWLRTSLSFASIGIAVTQLFRLNTTISKASIDPADPLSSSPQAKLRHVGKPLGATFIAISILILFIGFHRYFEAQHYVIRGKFPASRGSILVVTVVAGALIVCSLVVILSVGSGAFER